MTTDEELKNRADFIKLFKLAPIPDNELLYNLGLFIKSFDLKRMLFLNDIYQKILPVNGVIMEFGTRWGQNLAWFTSLRGIYEPFNYSRKIIGFDTFEGFSGVNHLKDGDYAHVGDFNVTEGYEYYLEKVLDYHEAENSLTHVKKYELIKGDVHKTLPKYLQEHPETIISLAYFDLDLYGPTRCCLENIAEYVTKGSILVFDELNYYKYPGETVALKEVIGLNEYKIQRSPFSSFQSYIQIE
jgi:hypothetical protein